LHGTLNQNVGSATVGTIAGDMPEPSLPDDMLRKRLESKREGKVYMSEVL
jgi:hypothetical protein